MNCKQCGSLLTENDQFCKNCGAAVTVQEQVLTQTSNSQTVVQNPTVEALNHTVNQQPVQPTVEQQPINNEQPNYSNKNVIQSENTFIPQNPTVETVNQISTQQPVQPVTEQQPINNAQPNYSNNTVMQNGNNPTVENYNQAPVQQPVFNQQPLNNVQSNYPNNSGMHNGYNMPSPKSNNVGKYVGIAAGLVVVVALILLVQSLFFKGKDDNPNGGTNNPGLVQNPSNIYKVNFKGFTFSIPDNYVYEESGGTLIIGDEEGTWATLIELEEGSFAQLKTNKSQLHTMLQQFGYTASLAVEKKLAGVEFITMEISSGGENAIAAFAKANSMYFIGITAMNKNNEFDYKLLEKIAPILKSAKLNSSATNNLSSQIKLDMKGFSELVK